MKGKGELLLHRERLVREQKRWKRWQKAVSVMAAMVVFCTAYALILPAVTMGAKTYCGMEEHQHGEECFVLLRKGAATPGDAYVVTPEEAMKASGSNAVGSPATPDDQNPGETDEDRIPATPGDAQTREEDYELATPGNAEEDRPEGPAGEETEDVPESGNPENLEDSEGTQPENVREGNSEDESLDLSGDYEAENSGYTQDEGSVDLATPGNAKAVSTASRKGDKKVVEEDDEEELATPGNASLVKVTTSQKSKTHSASNAYEEDDEEYDPEDDLEEYDEPFDEDIELINDLETEPEEEEEELEADWIPYEPGMDYDEDIYELIAICGMEEHTHSLACYSDPEADVETEEDWLRTIPQLTGKLPEDIVAVADSQVEYRESEKNYQVEGVDTIKGYTRYGQWYGEPYRDWSGMFASFCINYAGGEDAPVDADGRQLAEKLKGTVPGLYKEKGEYDPRTGDLVFLSGENGEDLRVGIVKEITKNENGRPDRVVTIQGDFNNKVAYQTYSVNAPEIEGYGLMSWYGLNLVTVRKETENAVITVVYEESALPRDVRLEAEELKENDPNTVAMKAKLTEQGNSQGKVLKAMIPLNVTFLDSEGNPVEATGPIEITAEFKTPVRQDGGKEEAAEEGPDVEQRENEEPEEKRTEDEREEPEAVTETENSWESESKESETDKALEKEEFEGADLAITEEAIPDESLEDADKIQLEEEIFSGSYEDREADKQEAFKADEPEPDGWNIPEEPTDVTVSLSVSAKTVTRVGTGTKGKAEETSSGQKEEQSGTQKEEEPVWELFHISEDGEPENLSGSNTTRIQVDKENALQGVTFQSDSSIKVAAVSYDRTGANSRIVKTYAQLKSAAEDSTVTYIELGADIEIPENQIPALPEGGSARTAVNFKNKGRTVILNLARHSLSLETLKSEDETLKSEDKRIRLIGVYNGAILTLIDEDKENRQVSRPTSEGEPEELGSLHYDDDKNHQNQPANDPEWKLGMRATYAGRNLRYYLTTSELIDKRNGQTTGATREKIEEFLLTNPGVITNGTSGTTEPAIYVHNSTLNLESGAIAGCKNWAIRSVGGSQLNLNGGYICANECGDWGGAIRIEGVSDRVGEEPSDIDQAAGNSVATISGDCIISGNYSSANGGAVAVRDEAELHMTGGYITNNQAGGSGGGICIEMGGMAYLSDGYVTNNWASESGGGVYKIGQGTLVIGKTKEEEEGNGTHQDSQIHISRNLANNHEGGGCTVEQGYTKVYGGYITNNRTNTEQHWGGGGMFIADGAQGYVENVLVTNNKAGGFGGGVTGCPTSRIYMNMDPGMAIFDNKAGMKDTDIVELSKESFPKTPVRHLSGQDSSKRQDHQYSYRNKVFMDNGYDDFYCALTCDIDCKMLGNNSANWKGSADSIVVDGTDRERLTSISNMGLTAYPTEQGKSDAKAAARLFFNGNSSWTHAGGILCNGYMIAGLVEKVVVPDRMVIVAKKAVVDESGQEVAWDNKYSYEFGVYNNTAIPTLLGTFKNDKSWEIDFNIMLGGKTEDNYVYYVKEQNVANGGVLMDSTVYRITITLEESTETLNISGNHDIEKYLYKIQDIKVDKRFDGQMAVEDGWVAVTPDWDKNNDEQGHDTLYLGGRNKPAFVNRLQSSTQLKVRKVWNDAAGGSQQHEAVTVYLTRNGEDCPSSEKHPNPVSLNEKNDWTYTWSDLPVSENGTPYTYFAREEDVPDYVGEITVTQQPMGYWVPARGPIEEGKQYVIVNKSGDKVLTFSGEQGNDHNIYKGSGDLEDVARENGTITINGEEYQSWYSGDVFKENSIFTAHHPGNYEDSNGKYDNGHEFFVLRTSGLKSSQGERLPNAWLASENYGGNNNNWLKTTSSDNWASACFLREGKLVTDTERWWDGRTEKRIMIYDESEETFGTIEGEGSDKAAEVYTFVYAGGTSPSEITITNTPSKDVLYRIHITKVSSKEGANNARLPGAKFKLLNDKGEELKFLHTREGYAYHSENSSSASSGELITELVTDDLGVLALYNLPGGIYTLREIEPPAGYIAIEDMEIRLEPGGGTQKEIEIREPVYNLPETGGRGIYWYTLGGMLLMAGSLLCGCSLRRKRERRVRK